ncbi:MAG: M48 family metalloprotease [Pseudomonadota bacterium]
MTVRHFCLGSPSRWIGMILALLTGLAVQAADLPLAPARLNPGVEPDISDALRPNTYLGNLPEIGSSSAAALSPAQEHLLGKAFMRSLRKQIKVLDDPLLNDYLWDLGQRLASRSDEPGRHFYFFLVDAPEINAFAGPNGYIGVHAGLILATEGEDELAAVMAHETAHVTQKHLLRAFDDTSRFSLATAALMIAAAIAGSRVSGDAAIAAVLGVQAGALQHQINFTRQNEWEADRVGMQILAGAQFDPRAMPVFFERLSRATRSNDTNAPEFLRTHPVTTNRIADSLERAEKFGYKQYPEDIRYGLTRAALKAQSFVNPVDAVDYFKAGLREGRYRDLTAHRYGYALALLRQHQTAAVAEALAQLLKPHPHQPAFLILQARLHQSEGALELGLKTLQGGLALLPGNYPLRMTEAEFLLAAGRPKAARETLLPLLTTHPDEPEVYKALAQASGEAGDPLIAHRYLAEQYYLNGQIEAAIAQLEAALRKPGDFQKTSEIDARLRVLKDELKEMKKEGYKPSRK